MLMLSRSDALLALTALGYDNVAFMTKKSVGKNLEQIATYLQLTDIDNVRDRLSKEVLTKIFNNRKQDLKLQDSPEWPVPKKRRKEVVLPAISQQDPLLGPTEVTDMMFQWPQDPNEPPEFKEAVQTVAKEVIRRATAARGKELKKEDDKSQDVLAEVVASVQFLVLPKAVTRLLGWVETVSPQDGGSAGSIASPPEQ